MADQYEPVEGDVIRTTEDAILLETADGDEEWVPRSVCYEGPTLEEGDTDVQIERWWLRKKGWL